MFWSLNQQESKVITTVFGIYIFRMLGLFMIMPALGMYAHTSLVNKPWLVGLAMGSYGFTQALLQIPFGTLSDHWGRRPVIFLGLACLLLGSLVAAFSQNIYLIIAGRALQGMGAIGGTLMALISDVSREQVRTQAMAYLGAAIGCSFVGSILLGSYLSAYFVSLQSLFGLTAVTAAISLLIAVLCLPKLKCPRKPRGLSFGNLVKKLWQLLMTAKLQRLYLGSCLLHGLLAALFLILPGFFVEHANAKEQLWLAYAGSFPPAFVLSLVCIHFFRNSSSLLMERISIFLLFFSYIGLIYHWELKIALLLFFTGFSILEAQLPSQLSRMVGATGRGMALSVYSTLQFLGIFLGGVGAGLAQTWGGMKLMLLGCMCLSGLWLIWYIKR
jgi:MFS family permease